jgi:hypothetical protein
MIASFKFHTKRITGLTILTKHCIRFRVPGLTGLDY